ncbi:MAG: hypothetical protein M0Z87_09470 [Actinomycetota bacterium]|nr:hypothetical protein [Actinomycetota bacterium]
MSTPHDSSGHLSAQHVAEEPESPAEREKVESLAEEPHNVTEDRREATPPRHLAASKGARAQPAAKRALIGFGRFWWEFLIGDTPELFVGMLVVLGAGAAMVAVGLRALAWLMVPLLVIAVLTASVMHGRQQR